MSNTVQTETSVRRTLARAGLQLQKRRDGFMVLDRDTRAILGGGYPVPYSLTLDEAECFVDWYRPA